MAVSIELPELRQDPVTGEWVIMADRRGQRPQVKTEVCPFCEGNEHLTAGPELYRLCREDGSGWLVRGFPNLYPALMVEGDPSVSLSQGIYSFRQGTGAHEVIVGTPCHGKDLTELSIEEMVWIFQAYCARTIDLTGDLRFEYILIFKNFGPVSGASIEHEHSQLIATPIVPYEIQKELSGLNRNWQEHGQCIYCAIIQQVLTDREHLICQNEDFIALTWFAAKFKYQSIILPKAHTPTFVGREDSWYRNWAVILKEFLLRLQIVANNPSYNFVLHPASLKDPSDLFHFHQEFFPRLNNPAGFELGSGISINPHSPEKAARQLREVALDNIQ